MAEYKWASIDNLARPYHTPSYLIVLITYCVNALLAKLLTVASLEVYPLA